MYGKGFTVALLLVGFVLVATVQCATEKQVRVLWCAFSFNSKHYFQFVFSSCFDSIHKASGGNRQPSIPCKFQSKSNRFSAMKKVECRNINHKLDRFVFVELGS